MWLAAHCSWNKHGERNLARQIVHVIDDDNDVLEALAFLLETSGFSVQVHESATSFLQGGLRHTAGCVVADIRIPGIDGLELQRRLVAQQVRVPVIMMTGDADVALAVEAMKAGAFDLLEKPFDNRVLVRAVKAALATQRNERERAFRSAECRRRMQLLSERERQVLAGLVAGKSNKIIAYDLSLSFRMVEGYRASMMDKMQAENLSHLVRMVLSNDREV